MTGQKLKIILTGGESQTAEALRYVSNGSTFEIFSFSRRELDITSPQAIDKTLTPLVGSWQDEATPILFNLAAYTAVDLAEEKTSEAFAVNRDAVGHLAHFAQAHFQPLVHLSTDFVFDGRKETPYHETDSPHPLSVYGQSKWAGEKQLHTLQAQGQALVVRTSWLFSPFRHNFFKTIAKLLAEGKPLRVVNDQIGSPTSALDLARFLLHVATCYASEGRFKTPLVHFANGGATSWYGFAQAIASKLGYSPTCIAPIATAQYPTAAIRPRYSVLSTDRLQHLYKFPILSWLEALSEVATTQHTITRSNNA